MPGTFPGIDGQVPTRLASDSGGWAWDWVKKLLETGGAVLSIGAIADGQLVVRSGTSVVGDGHKGDQAAGVHGSTSAATASKLMHRDASGRAEVADPTAAAEIATKGYVDSAVLDRDTSITDVVNTAAETDLYSFSVAGGTFGTNKKLKLVLFGDYLNGTGAGATVRIRMYYGATLIYDATSPSISSGGARRTFFVEVELMGKGVTNDQIAWGFAWIGNNGVSGGTNPIGTSGMNLDNAGGHTAVAVDSTVAQNLRVTATHSVASVNASIREITAMLEVR